MLDPVEIKRLILRAAARDEGSAAAFGTLYDRCAPLLLGIALRIVGRREVAEEVLHDSFVKIWNGAGSFDPLAAQPVAWMAAIARNCALDTQARADVSRVAALSDFSASGDDAESTDELLDRLYDWRGAPDAGESLDEARTRTWLRDCLDELAATERQALVLSYHHGMSNSELAEHLKKPLGTVKTWIRRALGNLRDCVEHCMGGDAAPVKGVRG
jgi:RNA polymerase sigma-70 factor (ECF subfamily)